MNRGDGMLDKDFARSATTMTATDAVLPKRSVQLSAPEAAQLIRDAVDAGGEMWVSGSGQSMHPTIRDADSVLISPVGRDVRPRDVVLVPLGPRLMLHRVVCVANGRIRTRGDARRHDDPSVERSDVVARAVAARHDGRVTPLVLTMRFGARALARYLLVEAKRRARLALAALSRPGGRNEA